jgi:hypothetical protein
LAAILRVADAIDCQHADCIQTVNLTFKRNGVIFRLRGRGDLLMAKWALAKRADLFEELFGTLVVEEPPRARR